MRSFLYRLCVYLVAASVCAACTLSGAGGAVWIPPSSPPSPTPLGPLPLAAALQPPTPTDPPLLAPTLAATPVPLLPDPPTLVNTPILLNTPGPTSTPTETPVTTPTQPGPTTAPGGTPGEITPTPVISAVDTAPILYYAQAGDTLNVTAVRFGVFPAEITSPDPLLPEAFINPGQLLIIPRRLTNTTSNRQLLPDSEVVFSPSAVNFDTVEFAKQAGGYLSSYQEWHKSTGMKSGAEIVQRVAIENSINPRLLLALLEYQSHWVYGRPDTQDALDYPMGLKALNAKGLYNQLVWAVNQLSNGYYAYREGRLTEIQFKDKVRVRLAPDLNAGTAALQYYFAQLYTSQPWVDALDPQTGLPGLHTTLFGDPWTRARSVEPLFPPGIAQPPLTLPFNRNWTWSYTGGPHGAWEHDGAYAALDFAPGSTETGCTNTPADAVAAAAGLVVRTGPGLVVLDLDGDGYEQTGWVLVYLHIAEKGRVQVGDWLATGDPVGKPSCEGGFATGTHLHIARKFNGEWVPAAGPLPFNLGGWIAHAGEGPYKGTLTRGDVTLTACTCSNYLTFVIRTESDP